MAHEIEQMFSVVKTPWHGLGHIIENAPTISEGIKLAGLDWDILVESAHIKMPYKAKDELTSDDVIRHRDENLDDFCRVFVRSDNGKIVGLVGPRTHPLQNSEAFSFFQPFIDAKEATLETAGSLKQGEKVWVMAKINRDNSVIRPGDEVAKFVLLSNSHDGTTAVRVGFTPIRVVCANTLSMAHGDKASKLLRVRHSKDVKHNLEKIRETMNLANEEFEATAEQFRFLAGKQINQTDLRKYVKDVFSMEDKDADMSTRSANILRDIINQHEQRTGMMNELTNAVIQSKEVEVKAGQVLLDNILENFESGLGSEIKSTRGSYWTAYNAVNEYLNHERGHTADTRINSLWFGESSKVNRDALQTALTMANAG